MSVLLKKFSPKKLASFALRDFKVFNCTLIARDMISLNGEHNVIRQYCSIGFQLIISQSKFSYVTILIFFDEI